MNPQSDNHLFLSISDRIAIVNSQIELDRGEVRRHQDQLLQLSYLVIPAFVAIVAFDVTTTKSSGRLIDIVSIVGQCLLLALYLVISLQILRKHLPSARACLTMREEYFHFEKEGSRISPDKLFNPIREVGKEYYTQNHLDDYLWLPFYLTVAAGVLALVFMIGLLVTRSVGILT